METHGVSRRSLLKGSGAVVAGATIISVAGPPAAFADRVAEEVIPWSDQPPEEPSLPNQLVWEELDSYLTPADNFFVVSHYNQPAVNGADWRLAISGLVERPRRLDLQDLRSYPRREVDFTLECSGNTGLPFFTGGIGTARWAGARLSSVLRRSNLARGATEVVFWGADQGTVTVADNSGILSGGRTGTTVADGAGGLDLKITEHFSRSMSIGEALDDDNLLCYEMNGGPLPPEHGYPVRLIAPGWYGVANVKWLNRIEIRDGRSANRFMARDYVTVREQTFGGETVWTFTTVSHARLKSAPAKVTHVGDDYAVQGAAWGAPIGRVEVQIDDGPWRRATIKRRRPRGGQPGFAWVFWTYDWGTPTAGEHTVRSRALDTHGAIQPAPDDPFLASKVTYWESNGQITRTVDIP